MESLRDLFIRIVLKTDVAALKEVEADLERIKTGAKWAGGAVAVAFTAIGGYSIKLAGNMEQTRISFETMTGSVEKSNKLIAELRTLAQQSPFTFTDTIGQAKRLLGYNIELDKVTETMKMLGDIAAGVGNEKLPNLVTALGQVKAKTLLSGEELRQFTETGIPLIEALSKTTGFSQADIAKSPKDLGITYDMVYKSLKKMTGEGGKFFDLMAKQSKSFFGQMSNLVDVIEEILTYMGEPMADGLKIIIEQLRAYKDIIKVPLIEWGKKVGSIFKFIGQNLKTIAVTTGFIVMSLTATALMRSVKALAFWFATISTASLITSATWILLGVLAAALYLIIEDIYYYFSGDHSLIGEMVKYNEPLQKLMNILKAFGTVLAGFVANFTHLDTSLMIKGFEDLGNAILAVFGTSGQTLIESWRLIFIDLGNWLSKIIDKVTAFFSGIGSNVLNFVAKFIPGNAEFGAGTVSKNQASITNKNTGGINITISGSGTPKETAQVIGDYLGDYFSQTIGEF